MVPAESESDLTESMITSVDESEGDKNEQSQLLQVPLSRSPSDNKTANKEKDYSPLVSSAAKSSNRKSGQIVSNAKVAAILKRSKSIKQ